MLRSVVFWSAGSCPWATDPRMTLARALARSGAIFPTAAMPSARRAPPLALRGRQRQRHGGFRDTDINSSAASRIEPPVNLRQIKVGAALPGADCRPRRSGRRRRLASRAPTAATSPGSSGPGRGAAPHRRASMQIWTLCSTPRSTLRLVPRATAPSAAGRWSVMSGNGRPPTSRHFPALLPTLMKTIHGRGSVRGRCCAAGAGRQALSFRSGGKKFR
jgi:hypothetical protein